MEAREAEEQTMKQGWAQMERATGADGRPTMTRDPKQQRQTKVWQGDAGANEM